MKKGDVLVEKYTNLGCNVIEVFDTHMIVEFKESGLSAMICEDRYIHYKRISNESNSESSKQHSR